MLLEIKFPGVETPCVPEGGELPGWENCFQELASREGKQLGNVGRDRNTWLANAEELIDEPS